VVSRHQATQQYGAILPIELTSAEIRNSKAYQEYYACAMGEAAPKPKASARKKKGEGTCSKPWVPDVPSDDSEEELSWKSSDDEEVGGHKEDEESDDDSDEGSDKDSDETVKSGAGKDGDEDDDEDDDDDDEEEETAKDDEEDKDTGKGGNEVRKSRGESEEEEETTFRFEERLRLLETSFYEYRQTNQFADAVSAIPGIVHQYMDQQMKETTDRLQDLLQRGNDEFLRNIDENMKKVLKGLVKDQVKEQVSRILPRIKESVNATLEAEVLTRSSHSSRTSYAALVETYEADKAILDTYGESTILKRRREDDDQEGPSAGPNRGSKRQKEGGEQASASTPSEKETKGTGGSTTGSQSRQQFASQSAYAEEPVQTTCQMEETPLPVYETEEPMQTTCQMDEPPHSVFETGADDQPIVQTSQHLEWFSQPRRPPSPDRDWNKTLPAAQGDAQSWISDLARQTDARSSFNELLDTPIDFSNFIMNRLSVDTLTPKLLAGPIYELMRGSCNSLTGLEYHLEEVYKATMNQLDWVNPEGQQYPHNLLQPLPLIPDNRGRRVIPFDHFINNDLEYLRGDGYGIKAFGLGFEDSLCPLSPQVHFPPLEVEFELRNPPSKHLVFEEPELDKQEPDKLVVGKPEAREENQEVEFD
nr:hypothetical protein [Tanacetum cinerariifolium]